MSDPSGLAPLTSLAARVAESLRERGQTVAVVESSAGGLVCAALLAIPGASAYFVGGTVIYTRKAGKTLLGLTTDDVVGAQSASIELFAEQRTGRKAPHAHCELQHRPGAVKHGCLVHAGDARDAAPD